MKLGRVSMRFNRCDGCSKSAAHHSLKFNDLEDRIYMCEECFGKLQSEIFRYTEALVESEAKA